jgi:hypothetical protein
VEDFAESGRGKGKEGEKRKSMAPVRSASARFDNERK